MRDIKKSEKADLENKRVLFIEIGLIFALAFVIFAFEWKNYDKETIDLASANVEVAEEELVIRTEQNQPPPPPPPPQQQTTIIEIVEDDVEVEDDLDINMDVDEETEVEEYIPPVEEDEEEEDMTVFTVVEDPPMFIGGQAALMKYLGKNITYPQMAKETGIQGTVYVSFVVERKGNVTSVKIARGIGGGCDEEALRVVKAMPKWKAGKQRGKPVRVNFTLPVKFVLN